MQEFRKYGTCGSYKTTCKISGNEDDRCHINYTHILDDSDIYIPGFDDDGQKTQTKNK